jgi:hypothetical protein
VDQAHTVAAVILNMSKIFPSSYGISDTSRGVEVDEGHNGLGLTHSLQLGATVTAFGRGSSLLDMEVSKVSAGGLDDADLV